MKIVCKNQKSSDVQSGPSGNINCKMSAGNIAKNPLMVGQLLYCKVQIHIWLSIKAVSKQMVKTITDTELHNHKIL